MTMHRLLPALAPALASTLLHAQGPRQFEPELLPNPTGSTIGVMATADVDGDGDIDVFDLGSVGPTPLYRNDSFGRLTHESVPSTTSGSAFGALGDWDGDGDIDVVQVSGTFRRTVLLENDGSGRFSARTVILTSDGAGLITLLDLDGDGDLDLLAAPFGTRPFTALNDGAGQFTPSTWAATATYSLNDHLVALDADGDGDTDAFVFSRSDTPKFLRNRGDGGCDEVLLPLPPGFGTAGDFDGDGYADAVGFTFSGQTQIARGGPGGFGTPTAIPIPTTLVASIACDVDLDGDLDLVGGDDTSGTPALMVWVNDGAGQFTDVTAQRVTAPAARIFRIHAADFDGDGDPEVLATDYAPFPSRIRRYLNRHLDLRAPATGSLGGTLDLDVARAPGYATTLSLALIAAGLEAPRTPTPFGTLRLDTTAASLPFVSMPPNAGTGRIAFQIPVAPALAGGGYVAQALIVDLLGAHPPRLTAPAPFALR